MVDEGFIHSNKYRRIIFDCFITGDSDINYIAKKNRIIPVVVKKVVNEFIQNGIIEKKGEKYILTKEGEKLKNIIQG